MAVVKVKRKRPPKYHVSLVVGFNGTEATASKTVSGVPDDDSGVLDSLFEQVAARLGLSGDALDAVKDEQLDRLTVDIQRVGPSAR